MSYCFDADRYWPKNIHVFLAGMNWLLQSRSQDTFICFTIYFSGGNYLPCLQSWQRYQGFADFTDICDHLQIIPAHQRHRWLDVFSVCKTISPACVRVFQWEVVERNSRKGELQHKGGLNILSIFVLSF